MSIIRQSTARTVLVGPILDSLGAAKTDEVVGSIKVTKNGTVAGANGSATLTHDHAGKYKLALTTSDTDTVGVLEISLNSGTNDMPVARFNVVEEAVFDAYFAASATMPVTLAPDSEARILDRIEFTRGHHTVTGSTFYVDGVGGNDTTGNGRRSAPWKTISKALTAVTSNMHDEIVLLPNSGGGPTTITESAAISVTKNYVQIRGPGRDVVVTRSNNGDIFDVQANGVELSGFRISTFGGATSNAVVVSGGKDFARLHRLWIENAHQDAIYFNVANRCEVTGCVIIAPGRDGVRVSSGAGSGTYNLVLDNVIRDCVGSAVNLQGSDASDCRVQRNVLRDNAVGVTVASGVTDTVIADNRFVNNGTNVSDSGTHTLNEWNSFGSEARSAVGLASANLDTQLGDLPTNAELSAALAAADDAVLAAIAALNNLSSAGAQAAAAAALTAYDAATGSDVPGAATVASAVRAELATELGRVDVATSTRLAASGYAAPDNASVGAIKAVTDKLDTTLVQDGAVYDFTGAALAAAPTSSGGGGASAVDIAGAVCDELLASHTIPGSLGEAVAAAGTAGNPWISDLSGYVAGQAGYELHALYDQVMDVLPDYPTISVPAPPTAEQSTAWIRCLDEHGTPEGGVTIQLRMAYAEGGADAYDSTVLSATSAPGTGLWSQTIPRGAGYLFDARRGTEGRWTRFRGANTPTVLLPSLLGTP